MGHTCNVVLIGDELLCGAARCSALWCYDEWAWHGSGLSTPPLLLPGRGASRRPDGTGLGCACYVVVSSGIGCA